MAHDIQASVNIRHRRWTARQREKKLAAIAEAKRLHREALDAARVNRGLLPIAEARREKVRKFRQKQADTKAMIATMWFAPPLDFDALVNQRILESPNLDSSLVRNLVVAAERNCIVNVLNLNAFTLARGIHIACHQRTVAHELWESGVPLGIAVERATREPFVPNASLTGIPQALDTCRRFDAAREKWGDGSGIVDLLLGRKGEEGHE